MDLNFYSDLTDGTGQQDGDPEFLDPQTFNGFDSDNKVTPCEWGNSLTQTQYPPTPPPCHPSTITKAVSERITVSNINPRVSGLNGTIFDRLPVLVNGSVYMNGIFEFRYINGHTPDIMQLLLVFF